MARRSGEFSVCDTIFYIMAICYITAFPIFAEILIARDLLKMDWFDPRAWRYACCLAFLIAIQLSHLLYILISYKVKKLDFKFLISGLWFLLNKVGQMCISGLILLVIIFPLVISLVLFSPILFIVFANLAFGFMYSKYIKNIENAKCNGERKSEVIDYILSGIFCLGLLSCLLWFATICLTITINNPAFSLPIVGSVSTVLLSQKLIGDQ